MHRDGQDGVVLAQEDPRHRFRRTWLPPRLSFRCLYMCVGVISGDCDLSHAVVHVRDCSAGLLLRHHGHTRSLGSCGSPRCGHHSGCRTPAVRAGIADANRRRALTAAPFGFRCVRDRSGTVERCASKAAPEHAAPALLFSCWRCNTQRAVVRAEPFARLGPALSDTGPGER